MSQTPFTPTENAAKGYKNLTRYADRSAVTFSTDDQEAGTTYMAQCLAALAGVDVLAVIDLLYSAFNHDGPDMGRDEAVTCVKVVNALLPLLQSVEGPGIARIRELKQLKDRGMAAFTPSRTVLAQFIADMITHPTIAGLPTLPDDIGYVMEQFDKGYAMNLGHFFSALSDYDRYVESPELRALKQRKADLEKALAELEALINR